MSDAEEEDAPPARKPNPRVRFAVSDARDGRILRTGSCAESDVPLQARIENAERVQAWVDDEASPLVVHDVFHRVDLESGRIEEIPGRVAGVVRLDEMQKEQRARKRERLRERLKDPGFAQRALEHLLRAGLLDEMEEE